MSPRFLSSIGAVVLLAGAALAQVPYGTPTAGPGGIAPVLVCGQPWMGNLAFSMTIANGAGGANALLGVSTAPAAFAFGGTSIFIDPAGIIILQPLVLGGPLGAPGAGSATMPLPLALTPSPALAGLTVFAQAVVEDPSNPGVFAATRAVRLELGYPPLVFVGTSVGGSVDNHYFVDPLSQTLVHQGGNNYTDNVSGAIFAHGGEDLFVSTSISHRISRADVTAMPPAWTDLYNTANVFYGIGHDWLYDRVYSLTGATATTRELVAIDSNPNSATYGTVVGSTLGLGGGATLERWGLSIDGKHAAIASIFGSGGQLIIVDTDAGSGSYMQPVITSTVPGTSGWGFSIGVTAGFTPNDEYVLTLVAGLGVQTMLRYHFHTLSWVDHDPVTAGIQHIVFPNTVPSSMAVSPDGTFAIVTGNNWVSRVDLYDAAATPNHALTPILPGSGLLANAYGASISRDGTMAAFTSTSPPKLIIVDTATGALIGNVALPGASNIYTSAWR
jgi:hypothetical protein